MAANQLAVEAVNHESDTLDQEIRNLKTELELRRELANNSPMAIIQRHGTRAAGSRGIYEGDPVPDRLDRLQRATREARHERGLAAPALAFSRRAAKALLLAVVIIAAAVGANLVGIYLVGSVAGWERWLAASARLLPGVAAVPVRRDGLWLGLDAPPAAGPRGRRASAATPGAQRDRRRRRHRGAGSQPADAELKREAAP